MILSAIESRDCGEWRLGAAMESKRKLEEQCGERRLGGDGERTEGEDQKRQGWGLLGLGEDVWRLARSVRGCLCILQTLKHQALHLSPANQYLPG